MLITEAGGLCFKQNYEKYQSLFFLSETFSVFGGEIFYIFEQACFRNGPLKTIEQIRKKKTCKTGKSYFYLLLKRFTLKEKSVLLLEA